MENTAASAIEATKAVLASFKATMPDQQLGYDDGEQWFANMSRIILNMLGANDDNSLRRLQHGLAESIAAQSEGMDFLCAFTPAQQALIRASVLNMLLSAYANTANYIYLDTIIGGKDRSQWGEVLQHMFIEGNDDGTPAEIYAQKPFTSLDEATAELEKMVSAGLMTAQNGDYRLTSLGRAAASHACHKTKQF